MSTNDVPGANPAHGDTLAMGCWAETKDGSLLVVASTEGKHVVYSMFDTSRKPIVEYRDKMKRKEFERQFSYTAAGAKPVADVKWTWHDKTPFDWDRVIKQGALDGVRYASASDQLSAAERVAQDLSLRGAAVDAADHSHKVGRKELKRALYSMVTRFNDVLDSLRK